MTTQLQGNSFFYDGQIRRYILQFIRIFASLQIQSTDSSGNATLSRVPIHYGDMSRQAAQIIQQNSENTVLPVPIMAAWVKNLTMAPERRNDPMFVGQVNVVERDYNPLTQEYGTQPGNQYSVQRYMPVPYNMLMQLDILTTTTTTKLQILEQILVIFNPAIQIQNVDNVLDWSTITEVEMKDLIWSNRNIPVNTGNDETRDVCSITFNVPVWINPPAKVTRNKFIQTINANIHQVNTLSNYEFNSGQYDPLNALFSGVDSQVIVTPGDYCLGVGIDGAAPNEVILLTKNGIADPTLSFNDLFGAYGNISSSGATLRLKTDNNLDSTAGDILGTITAIEGHNNKMQFIVDQETLPSTLSISPVNQIIDPEKVYPGLGLPNAASGQKYLLISANSDGSEPAINSPASSPWGTLTAYPNDIIYFDGVNWKVLFNSHAESPNQYVNNLATSQLLKFTGTDWILAYFGQYNPGYWKIEF